MPKNPTVFLSYRRSNAKELARYLHDKLVDLGADVFLDVETLNAGRFASIIQREIINREHFVVILKPDTLDSEWVRREVLLALEHRKNIVLLTADGFKFDEHVPPDMAGLKEYNGIPYYDHFAEEAVERVARAVGLYRRGFSLPLLAAIGAAIVLVAALLAFGLPALSAGSTATATPTDTATREPSATLTVEPTFTPTWTDTATDQATHTPEPSDTRTNTSTATETPTPTDTATDQATHTPQPISIPTMTNTASFEHELPSITITIAIVVTDPGASLHLRESPSSSATSLGLLPGGTTVTVLGQTADGSWLNVRLDEGIEGWVVAAYVRVETVEATVTPTATTAASAYLCEGQIISRSSALLNVVRANPSSRAPFRNPIQQGISIIILAVGGETSTDVWYQIADTNQTLGWIPAEYVVPSTSCP